MKLFAKKEDSYETYAQQIAEVLTKGGSITQNEATKRFGCTRLSAIIFVLKDRKMDITSKWEKGENRNGHRSQWKRYYLTEFKERYE